MQVKDNQHLFIRAAYSQATERPPVWFMRQAGRFMKEYWEYKNKYSFLEMAKTPEIAADITLLPVDLIHSDAAILFSDILVTAEAMGGQLSFEQGVGPVFANPVRDQQAIDNLEVDVIPKLQYVGDAIRLIQQRLGGKVPLIGFAGAPFTILSYLVEGGASRTFKQTKLLLFNRPDLAHRLLSKITEVTIAYLNMQIASGVDALQLFDSWADTLSWSDYKEFAHAYNKQILSSINRRDVPVISFCKGSSVFAPIMAESRPDVISVDWNGNLRQIKDKIPEGIAVQGNLDPSILYADKAVIKGRLHALMEEMRGTKGFILNLGHGIMPDMPFDHVKYAIEVIKTFQY